MRINKEVLVTPPLIILFGTVRKAYAIEFKRNYQLNKQILQQDLEKLYQVIEETLKKN